MASRAAFNLHRFVLVYERSGFVRVALEANCVLRRGCPQLPVQEPAVRIVAIAALHHSFVHPVMERARELLGHFLVAAIAELRLFFLHQALAFFWMVRRVAIDAAHIVLEVCRTSIITVLFAVGVAAEAALADFFCRYILESEDL